MCPWAKIETKSKAKRETQTHLLGRVFVYSHPLFGMVFWGTRWSAPARTLARLTENWRVAVVTKSSVVVYEEGM